MIKGRVKETLTKEFILKRISEIDIFKMYMPWDFKFNTACRSPFTEKDDSPSFIIGTRYDRITFKSFNGKNKGDVFHFVEQLFNISYNEALQKIAKDFGLLNGESPSVERIITPKEQLEPKKPTLIQIKAKKFSDEEKKYLSEYHLEPQDLQFCPDTKVYSVKEWAVNRLKMPLGLNEICFGYNLVNERGNWLKIYRPEASKKEKWRSSIPNTEIMGLSSLKKCDKLIISKSVKDAAVLYKLINIPIIVVQHEDVCIFTENVVNQLNSLCDNIYCSFDSDLPGKAANLAVTRLTGWKHINTPDYMLAEKKVKDWAGMSKEYHPSEIIKHFKEKGVI